MRSHTLGLAFLTTALLASCNTQVSSPSNSTELSPYNAGQLQALSFPANQDWLDGLRLIATQYHAFGGYGLDRLHQNIIIYTANSYRGRVLNEDSIERGRKLGLIRQAFINLLNSASNTPLATENGQELDLKSWKFKFDQTDASLDDLLSYKDALFLDADNNNANLLSFNMDTNTVIMQVKTEAMKAQALARFTALGIPEAKVALRFGDIRPTAKTIDVSQYRPVIGGVRVTMPNPNSALTTLCSLGLPVLLDGTTEGYITAGHCVLSAGANNGERMSQDRFAVATKFLDPALITCTTNCQGIPYTRYADAVFYKSDIPYSRARIIRTALTPGTKTSLQDSSGNDQYFDVTSTPGLPAVNEALINIGATSGYRSAVVTNQYTDINITVNQNGQTVRTWILRTVEVYNDGPANASCEGDSGSPWLQQISGTTNQVRFFGIQSAANIAPTANCGQYAYFSPVTQLENHFGVGRMNYKR